MSGSLILGLDRQFDMFAIASHPHEPVAIRIDDGASHAMVAVSTDGGVWFATTSTSYCGLCGVSGPINGEFTSLLEALEEGLRSIDREALDVQIDGSAGDRHRAFAGKVRAWVRAVEAEYFVGGGG